jgi:hypothetical protein
VSRPIDLHSAHTVAIGVTGHRFLKDTEVLIPAIDRVLTDIQIRSPNLPLTVISALAEGSDRLVTQRARALYGARLIVPLPMPLDEYVQDFEQDNSCEEFRILLAQATEIVHLPPAPNRLAAYATVGDYILVQSDILVALWDGQPSLGDGGTANVVAKARQLGHPMVWIRTCNRRSGAPIRTMQAMQGTVSYENL